MIYSNDLKNWNVKQGVSVLGVQLVREYANAPKFYGANRPLAKLAYAEEFEGDAERRTAAYSSVREDSSTASTYKLPAEVELCKRSNASKQKGIPSTIELTGKVYIKYVDLIPKLNVGDVKLLLNDDALSINKGDYENLKSSGYIKAKIFDGLVWQNISISELCTEKEYKFTKRQKAIDSALLCKTIIEERRGVVLYRTYRGHFTTQE